MAACPLCEKLTQLPGDQLVWQFPSSVAFLGPWQYYTGYCVLVARTHATELHHLPAPERSRFLDEMTLLAHAIEQTFQPRKMNYELLGNQVPHLHWHVFPRRGEDPEVLKPVWLALERGEQDPRERERLRAAPFERSDIMSRLQNTLNQLKAPSA
jgi:diadenosine tetraphosphate (Ap4A) HIT family hydrolase